MTSVFLSLGSNIEPEKNILEAVKLLAEHVRILEASTVYLTEPMRRRSQPKYYNCVLKIETDITPRKLKFDVLRVIEERLGRKRTEDKYAPRTIDIDIIVYGGLRLSTKDLVIPDPEIQKREFLAIPLCEIEPELVLPHTRKMIKEVASRFKGHKMIREEAFTETLQSLIRILSV
jgi:dihydroneopterin aldolase/2-amino-4-hydroxy-6-hydroxymethyldihydropteridine diphosphokinase